MWFVQVDSKYSCFYDIVVAFQLIHVHKLKVMFISLKDWYQLKEQLKCVIMELGLPCVIIIGGIKKDL